MIKDKLDLLSFLNMISSLENFNRSFKKKKVINKTAKSFFKYLRNKKSISAEDLCTLAIIIKASKVLDINDFSWASDENKTYVDIELFESLNNFTGIKIHISTELKEDGCALYCDIKTNFNNKNNKVSIDFTWTTNKYITPYKIDTRVYHLNEIDCVYKHYKEQPKISTDIFLQQSYDLIYSAFVIYFEKLFNEIEMRYCNEKE